jgi:hypothetical protein
MEKFPLEHVVKKNPQWVYIVEQISSGESDKGIEQRLNNLGSEGWEVVTLWPQPGVTNKPTAFYSSEAAEEVISGSAHSHRSRRLQPTAD